MTHPLSQMIVLLVAGTIMISIGGLIQIDPAAFHASAGIEVGDQIALHNELKAAGGALFAVGLFSLVATVVARLRSTALAASALICVGYGAARVLSFMADGVPNSTQLWIAGFEIVIAAICAATLAFTTRTGAHEPTARLKSSRRFSNVPASPQPPPSQ